MFVSIAFNSVQNLALLLMFLQPLSRDKNEKDDQAGGDKCGDGQNHNGTLVEKSADIWLSDAREAHESVLAIAGKSKDRINSVLVRAESINADGERKDELDKVSEGYMDTAEMSDIPIFWLYDPYRGR